ncbi:MAG: hypothetical protein RSC87_09815 [Muribaculaceae bacterium]
MSKTARIFKSYDNAGNEMHPATTVDAVVDMQEDGSAVKLGDILNAMIADDKLGSIASRAIATGECLYPDMCFSYGDNMVYPYNNAPNTGSVVAKRVPMPGTPTGSNWVMAVASKNSTAPGRGGVYQIITTRANGVFVQRIVAKIPVGFSLQCVSNSIGTGGTIKWATPNYGTGDWCEYIAVVKCGPIGTFSTAGFLYLEGGSPNIPVEWQIAMLTSYDAMTPSAVCVKQPLTYKLNLISSLTSSSTEAQIKQAFTPNGYWTCILPTLENIAKYDLYFERKELFTGELYTGATGTLLGIFDNIADSGTLELCITYYEYSLTKLKIGILTSGALAMDYITKEAM